MTPIVVDNSVFLAWCLADEEEPTATGAMQQVAEEGGIAPRIWWYELRNALLVNERRGRMSPQQVSDTLADSRALGISMDDQHDESRLLELARRHGLTVYDAAYLEVAFRRGLPLATLDRRLREGRGGNRRCCCPTSSLGVTAERATGADMGLDELAGCIEQLKARIRSHHTILEENETRTRAALIDPLLRALGWDVSDPAVVMAEYKVGTKSADYALLRSDGKAAATLEAKKLGESLGAHWMQMLNYANASGIEYAGITDGNHWEMYDVFRRGALEDRRILDVSIAEAPAHESALKLLLLWRPNLASGQPVTANTPMVEDDGSAPAPFAVEQASTPPPAASNWAALSEYNPPSGTPSPTGIRFWDGSERSMTAWRDILINVVEKLYGQGRLTVKDVPLWRGGQKYRVHTEPVHPTGKRFEGPKAVTGTPLFVNAHLSAADARRATRRLLKHYGLDPASVHLQESQ